MLAQCVSAAWLRIWCHNRSLQLWLWRWWGERAYSWKRLQEISTPKFSTLDFSSRNFSKPNFSTASYINVIYLRRNLRSTIFQNQSQMFYLLLTNVNFDHKTKEFFCYHFLLQLSIFSHHLKQGLSIVLTSWGFI